jgi:hypothetical protein
MALKQIVVQKIKQKSPLSLALFAAGIVYASMVADLAHETYKAYSQNVQTQRSIDKLALESKDKEAKASKIVVGEQFDTSFYQDAMNAYAKLNEIEGFAITPSAGVYFGTMRLAVVYDELSGDELKKIVAAFGKLGHISAADTKGMSVEVVKFTKDDALKQINGEQL